MIARIFVWIILLIALPDVYLYVHYVRHRIRPLRWWVTLLWWTTSVGMIAYTVGLSCVKSFIPDNFVWFEAYLLLAVILINPKVVFSICSLAGSAWCHFRHTSINRGNRVGVILAGLFMLVSVYGLAIGPRKLHVVHVNLCFEDLPSEFEGYKIVQFSDAHVGTFNCFSDRILMRDMDSIIAQKADLVCFTGDLVDVRASEIYPCKSILARLARESKAPVYSILGNHDYSAYLDASPVKKKANEKELQDLERQLGWRLLMNQHAVIHRGNDSIVIGGEENEGSRKFPKKSDLSKTLKGVGLHAFLIMLQHDPTAWDDSICPYSHAQLTLCGHTHGGQINILGLRPTRLIYREDKGLYKRKGRYLYVSSGVGALIPFRLGATPDIVVITLKKKSGQCKTL